MDIFYDFDKEVNLLTNKLINIVINNSRRANYEIHFMMKLWYQT